MRICRSLIEVPGNVERMQVKSHDFDADIVMLCLEDTVPADDAAKAAAREIIREQLCITPRPWKAREIAIRLNSPTSPWFLRDAELAVEMRVDTVVVPKVYGLEDVAFVERYLDLLGAAESLNVWWSFETPASLLDIAELARTSRRINGAMTGGYDYTLDSGCMSLIAPPEVTTMDDSHMVYNRQRVLSLARAKGWSAMDGLLFRDPKDLDMVRAVAQRSRQLGFDGAALYYPPHIKIANEIYGPTPSELAWAEDVIAAMEVSVAEGRAAAYINNRTVLPQHVKLAKRLLAFQAAL